MRTTLLIGILLTLGVGLAEPLAAQNRFPPEEGRRIRVTAPGQFLEQETGTVLRSNDTSVLLLLEDSGEQVELHYGEISWLEVSRGRSRGTLVGAAGGALLGGILATLTTPMPSGDDLDAPPSGDGGRFFLGAILGGFAGGLIGSSVQFEDWDPVFTAWPYWGGAGGQGGAGAGLLVSVSF